MGQTPTPKPEASRCKNCKWAHESDGITSFMGVDLCPLHAAAQKLLKACLEAVCFMDTLEDKAPVKLMKALDSAIKAAQGE